MRLGERIFRERSRRWRTRPEFARAAGLSVRTVLSLESGEKPHYSPGTLAAVESTLGWEPGSCLQAVAGGEPRRSTDPELARIMHVWHRLSRRERRMVVRVAEEALGEG